MDAYCRTSRGRSNQCCSIEIDHLSQSSFTLLDVIIMKKSAPNAPALYTGYGFMEDPIVIGWAGILLLSHLILQKSAGGMKPGVVAHQVCTLVAFSYAAYHGFFLWMYDDIVLQQHQGSYKDRLYGSNNVSFALCRFMIGFQTYDLISTALVPELRKLEIVGHHVATLLTAMASASHGGPFFTYYVPFFFGFTELSSVPLVFVDLFRQLPKLGNKFAALNELSRTLFAVSFLTIRVLCVSWSRSPRPLGCASRDTLPLLPVLLLTQKSPDRFCPA